MTGERATGKDEALAWQPVFAQELRQVNRRRGASPTDESNLAGLAISGGGIRSATFALGVLEALRDAGLLAKIDYLSTVSGGGYIGSWLSANCKRAADRQEASWLQPGRKWEGSIRHLRRYSKYLSPKVGFFSADTWSMGAIWLRNTLLVQLTIVFVMAVLLLVPRPLHTLFINWQHVGHWRWVSVVLFILAIAGVAGNQKRVSSDGEEVPFQRPGNWKQGLIGSALFLLAAWGIGSWFDFEPFMEKGDEKGVSFVIALLLVWSGYCLLPVGARVLRRQINYTQPWVQGLIVVPMMATGFLVAAILWGQASTGAEPWKDLDSYGGFLKTEWRYWPFPLWIALVSLWVLSFCSIPNLKRNKKGQFIAFLAPLPAVLVLYLLLCAIMLLMHSWAHDSADIYEGQWLAFMWAPALVLYAFALSIVVLIGILGRESTESVREWWSRLGAWLAIYGVAWMVIAIAAVYGPKWAAFLIGGDLWPTLSTAGGWLGTTLAGLLAGSSNSTGATSSSGESRKSAFDRVKEAVAAIGPFVFIAGMLIGVSTALHLVILTLSPDTASWTPDSLELGHWEYLSTSSGWMVALALLVTIAVVVLLAWRVDINEFSLNEFYRNRLSRCYLGATRLPAERKPQNFTGFDEKDDMPLANLAVPDGVAPGPLHIINCALNLGGSSDLTLHTRHSWSFTLTPYATGSAYRTGTPASPLGYRKTADYESQDGHPTLGQAVSVSGAAASPNMGYHTSAVVAFLLTVFNARLGWWFPSPRNKGRSPAPAFSLRYLFLELFGMADAKSSFLMISDGGHFENLAAYELIRRQCRVIIISDGECDPRLQFEGLGTLIRMAQVDFGVTIRIDVQSIRPAPGSPWSGNRCAIGRIEYDPGDRSKDGVLIYLKASMTGHEGSAILQYKAEHPAFPHESTGNQFYGEDQFESYRNLGRAIAERTFAPIPEEEKSVEAGKLWPSIGERLWRYFTPPLARVSRFTEHSADLMRLFNRLDAHPKLQIFSEQIENELNAPWPEQQSFRSAYLICSQMLQLMENVYLDLDLENTWLHPDNQGWRTTFQRWWSSAAMEKTWALSRDTYGQRFQDFCHRYLDARTAPDDAPRSRP